MTDSPWPEIKVSYADALIRLRDCVSSDVQYKLGAKANSLSDKPGDFLSIDCSGFVGWILGNANNGPSGYKDLYKKGSVQQREWFEACGFKKSTVSAGLLFDGILRIAFLSPKDGGGVGHVALILNGKTIESYGGVGPDRRKWTGIGWQQKTTVFVVCFKWLPSQQKGN